MPLRIGDPALPLRLHSSCDHETSDAKCLNPIDRPPGSDLFLFMAKVKILGVLLFFVWSVFFLQSVPLQIPINQDSYGAHTSPI